MKSFGVAAATGKVRNLLQFAIYLNMTINCLFFFQFLDPSVLNHFQNLVQRIEPALCVLDSILILPHNLGAIEHLTVILQEPCCQCPDMLTKHLCCHPLLAVGPHGLAHRRHYLRLQYLLAHNYLILVMLTADAE